MICRCSWGNVRSDWLVDRARWFEGDRFHSDHKEKVTESSKGRGCNLKREQLQIKRNNRLRTLAEWWGYNTTKKKWNSRVSGWTLETGKCDIPQPEEAKHRVSSLIICVLLADFLHFEGLIDVFFETFRSKNMYKHECWYVISISPLFAVQTWITAPSRGGWDRSACLNTLRY